MAGIAKGFPGVQALRGVDFRSAAARCTRCWARTAPARARCSRSWPAPRRPMPGTITFDGADGAPRQPARGAAPGHRHDLPGVQPDPDALGRRERVHRPRCRSAAAASTGRELHRRTRGAHRTRSASTVDPRAAGLRPLGRRAADGRDRARAVDGRQARGHGRADLGPVRQGGAAPVRDRARPQGQAASRSCSSPTGSRR